MRILLVSSYELGHQPLHIASPAAALVAAGHEVRALDLGVDTWDADLVRWADGVAFSVPMHTAMRVATGAAKTSRRLRAEVPICFYGLYAEMRTVLDPRHPRDMAIAGEYEPALVQWAGSLAKGKVVIDEPDDVIELGRHRYHVPTRNGLPSLDRYARLAIGEERKLVGYVEASHGCVHKCRHCPVPVVYDGRIRIVDVETVLADIARLERAGARHITFGDPDFLNGWRHSLEIVRAMHANFPNLTFDCTTKVEHVLEHSGLWAGFSDAGCLFVVSAFESLNNSILSRLDKGHVADEAHEAVELLRRYGIETRPSWLPFTPWTTFDDVLDILDFVCHNDMVGNVDPVQYAIRLLLPKGSLLLEHPDMQPYIGNYDSQRLSYVWATSDPAIDVLQQQISDLVVTQVENGTDVPTSYAAIRSLVLSAAGPSADGRMEVVPIDSEAAAARPRLTEPWFCCAEPTGSQFAHVNAT